MSSHLVRNSGVALLIAAISLFATPPITASAVEQTIVREETYQASENDSKTSCRQQAIAKLQQKALIEIGGVYVEKAIREEKKESNQGITSLTTEEKTNIVAGTMKTEIISEDWNGRTYMVRANIRFDQGAIMENLRRIAAERRTARDKQQEIDALKQQQAQQSQLVDQKMKLLDQKTLELDEKAKQFEIDNKRKADEFDNLLAQLKNGNNGAGNVTRSGRAGGTGTAFRRLERNEINQLIAEIRQQCDAGASNESLMSKLRAAINIR